MTAHNPNTAIVNAVRDRVRQCSTRGERATVLLDVALAVYDEVKKIPTGDGLDGFDSPERAEIGKVIDDIQDLQLRAQTLH